MVALSSGGVHVQPARVHVRPARPGDLPSLLAMVERCTTSSLIRRFHGGVGRHVLAELERVAAPTPGHRSWVAVHCADGAVRGTATLAWGRGPEPEVAFLVEDAWFRRGVGRALFRRLALEARRAGARAVVAWVQADNERAVRFLLGMAPEATVAFSAGELEVTVPVPPRLAARTTPASPSPAERRPAGQGTAA